MFENIGKKIKGLARVLFFLEAIGSFIVGIVLLANGDESTVIVGLLVMIGGILFSWVSVCLLYGFGEIIDKLQDIERNTRGAVGNTSSEKATPIAGTNAAEEAQAVTATKTIDRCDFCDKENVQGEYCKIVDSMGTRYRNLCCDCIEKNKKAITILK